MNYEPTYSEEVTLNWIMSELARIASAINSETRKIYYAQPSKIERGLLVIADGVQWDPLSLSGSTPYAVMHNGTSWQAI